MWLTVLIVWAAGVDVCAQSISQLTNVPSSLAARISNPTSFVVYNGSLYFVAKPADGLSHTQLYVYNGTEVRLVKNPLALPAEAGDPANLTIFRGRLYFSARTRSTERELWVTDGTPDGTQLFKEINPASGSGDPIKLTATSDKLFFTAVSDLAHELWVSDGTPDGTRRLANVTGFPVGGTDPTELTAVGNKLFYYATSGGFHGVWVTDGTAGGTRLVRGGPSSPGSPSAYFTNIPRNFSRLNNEKLIFRAAAEGTEDEPWISDGTSAGTFSPDIVPYPNGSFPTIVPGSPTHYGRFYFTTELGSNRGLYATDGHMGGTQFVKSDVSQAGNFTLFNDRLYFTVAGGAMWETDGSTLGTRAISGVPAGAQNLTVADNKLYFTTATSGPGRALWSTDGTAAGTRRVADGSGILEDRVKSLIVYNDQLYVTAFPFSSSTIPELFRLNANRSPVAPVIASATGRVGTWFNQVIPAFTDPDGGILTYTVTGLPAGLSFSGGAGGIIGGNPTVAGVYTVTVTATDRGGLSANATYTLTIESTGGSSNRPPVPPSIPDQMIDVNRPFVFTVPAFTDPEGRALTYQATGYPAGFSFFWSPVGAGQLSGQTPLAGQYTITVKATDPEGASSSTTFRLLVGLPTTTFQLLAPTYDCSSGIIRFNTSGGDGSSITYVAPGITRSSATANMGVVEAGLRNDPKPILLQAMQNGDMASYTFDLPTACGGGLGTPMGAFQLLAPNYDCLTGSIRFNTSGGDGSSITYVAPGISRSSPTDNSGIVEAGLRNDPKPIMLQAIQNGVTVVYTFDLPNACGGAPHELFQLLAPTYDCSSGIIRFNTSGGDGSLITYVAPGISRSSATANTGVVEAGLRNDPKPILLQAMQNGVTVSYSFDLPTACGGARMAAVNESSARLRVTVLGNPVEGESADIEIRGAAGKPLVLQGSDMQGNPIIDRRIDQAAAVEKHTIQLGRAAGIYLLRVTTPVERQTIKLVKP
jgi:ELWxxDGT repeat protein